MDDILLILRKKYCNCCQIKVLTELWLRFNFLFYKDSNKFECFKRDSHRDSYST